MAPALGDPAIYEALQHDPALLAAVAQSNSQGGAAGLHQLLGGSTSSASAAAPSAATVAEEPGVALEDGECPICLCSIGQGDAAMRCSGEGGVHHYFHAACLQEWIRSCRDGQP